jgi:HEAT repeat protein
LTYIGAPAVPQLRVFLRKENHAWQTYATKLSRYFPFVHYRSVDAGLCRERAAMVLAELGPAANGAIPDLVQCLRFPESVSSVEHALRRIGQATEPVLRASLRDRNPTIRQSAARLLGQLVKLDLDSQQALVRTMHDQNSGVRRQTALSLGEIRPCEKEIDTALATAVGRDAVPEVRGSAAEALGKHKCRAHESLIALENGMQDSAGIVRLQSAKALWLITGKAERVLPVLIQLLETPEGWQANYVLGMMRQAAAPAIPSLVRVLRTERVPRPFRTPPSSVFALGEIGAPAVPALIEVLHEPDPHNRFGAVIAFGLMGAEAKPAVAALIELLHDKDDEVRHATALTLGFIGADSEPVVNGLADCLQAEDIYMRSTAAEILRQIAPSKDWVVQAE